MESEDAIEDIEEELEGREGSPSGYEDWETLRRDVFTVEIDYTLGQLADMVASEEIDLKPEYQRRHRWTLQKKVALIESFLMNIPVPPIYLREDEIGHYSVIDGKQRLLTITEFILWGLSLKDTVVFRSLSGATFGQLPAKYQRMVKSRNKLRAVIILRQTDPDIAFETFMRLNTGGVPLNAQEIRNAAYPGPLNNLLLKLSEEKLFHRLLGIKDRTKSKMWLTMRDVEFVLRYLTFEKNIHTFTSRQAFQMNEFMLKNRNMSEPALDAIRSGFLQTLKTVDACFGSRAFKRWEPSTEKWHTRVLASLYDAQMFACVGKSDTELKPNRDRIVQGMLRLFRDEQFQEYISTATNTPQHFVGRIQMVREMIEGV